MASMRASSSGSPVLNTVVRSRNPSSAERSVARRSRSCDGGGVRLVEVLDFLAQRLEILPALFQVLVLPGGLLGELVDLAERFLQRVERGLLPLQVVGLRVERLHLLRQLIDALRRRRSRADPGRRGLPCPFPPRRSTSAAPSRAGRTPRTPSARRRSDRCSRARSRSATRDPSRACARSSAKLSRALVPVSSWPVTSRDSFSTRSMSSSVRVACRAPSFSLLICTSMAQIISFRRFDSTTACSTVCFWLSSALIFWLTCSASALSAAMRSSVVLLISWSCASGPSFFSTSFTISTVVFASSWVSRDTSRSRVTSCVSCVGQHAELLELPLERRRSARSTRLTAVCACRSCSRSSSSAACSFLSASRLARVCSACDDRLCIACFCFWSSPSGAVSLTVSCSACATASARVLMRASIVSSSFARASALASRSVTSSSRACGLPGLLLHLLQRLAGRGQLGAVELDLRQHRAEGRPLLPGRGDQRLELVGLLPCRLRPGTAHLFE